MKKISQIVTLGHTAWSLKALSLTRIRYLLNKSNEGEIAFVVPVHILYNLFFTVIYK